MSKKPKSVNEQRSQATSRGTQRDPDSEPLDFSPGLEPLGASPISEDQLNRASNEWKKDQDILFLGMETLIRESMSEYDFIVQNLNSSKVLGWEDSERRNTMAINNKTYVSQTFKPYKHFVRMNNESPQTFVSELTENPGVYGFLNIPAPILSFLVPRVRIYKARYESSSVREPALVEFVFDDHFKRSEVEAITTSRRNRGSGAGITSFTWDTLGTNPFEADKLIKADLNLHFQSIKDFSEEREATNIIFNNQFIMNSSAIKTYKYSELIVPSLKTLTDSCSGETFNTKYYRIMVDVGWAIPPGVDDNKIFDIIKNYNRSEGKSLKITPKDIREAVKQLRIKMFLTSPRHQINYNQDGSVDIAVEYVASINRVMGDPSVDVFRLSDRYDEFIKKRQKFAEEREEKDKQVADLQELSNQHPESQGFNDSEIGKIEKELEKAQEKFDSHKVQLYNSTIEALIKSQTVYSLDIVYDPATGIHKRADPLKDDGFFLPVKVLRPLAVDRAINFGARRTIAAAGERNKKYSVHYFFLGDLLDNLYKVLYKSGVTSFNEIRPLVGNFEYYNKGGEKILINLADLPISLNYFNLFLKRQWVDPKVDRYMLDTFLQNLLEGFLFPILNSTYENRRKNASPLSLAANIISAPRGGKDPVNELFVENDQQYSGFAKTTKATPRYNFAGSSYGEPNLSTHTDASIPFTYYIIYASSRQSRLFRQGNSVEAEERDKARGIYWIRGGQDVGALKEINFARNDIPFYREYLITQGGTNRTSNNEGNIDDVKFLKEKYNSTLTFFGIPNILPGQYIYIEPVSFGLDDPVLEATHVQQLGYSGYYIVIQASHKIERGVYETSVDARWESSGVKIEDQRGTCQDRHINKIVDTYRAMGVWSNPWE